MDNLFPREPLHDTSTSTAQTLSNDQATAVNLKNKVEFYETAPKSNSAPTTKIDAFIQGQVTSPADRTPADVFQSMEPTQIQSGTPRPSFVRQNPPTAGQTEPDTINSEVTASPASPIRNMADVDGSSATEAIPQSAERLDLRDPGFEELFVAQPVLNIRNSQSDAEISPTIERAISQTGETKKSADAPNHLVDSSPDVPGPLALSHLGQIPDEYPEDTKEELGRISANINAARPKSEQARQVFASRTRIRSLLELGHTVKEIYNHLVENERVSADKVSFKQFERQVDTLNLRGKPAKTPPPIRSTDRS